MEKSKGSRPTVLVTGPDKMFTFGWWATWFQLRRVGLRGIYLSSRNTEIPENIDGVIIGGGDDINPEHYGELGTGGANYDLKRDELELRVIELALSKNLPILGICRGSQLINVARGGNLLSDLRPLRKLTSNANSIFPVKTATIVANTKLSKIFGQPTVRINSLHHQAVNRLGDHLTIAARDDDGFVQAIESLDDNFIIGVQWHPEYLPQKRIQIRLFKALAKAVEGR